MKKQEFTREQIINIIGEAFPDVAHIYYKKPNLRKENEHQVLYIFDINDPVYNSKEIFKNCYEKIVKKIKVEYKKVSHFKYWDTWCGTPSADWDDTWAWYPGKWNRGTCKGTMESSVSEELSIRQTFTKTHVKVEFFIPGVFKSVIYFCDCHFSRYYDKSVLKNNDWQRYALW